MIHLAVFGQYVAKSLSPRIHELFAEQLGLPIGYTAIEVSHASFADQVQALASKGARGCNVTVPFKNDAWRFASRCSESANRAEAANTLVFSDGECYADNTDGGGLVNDLESGHGFEIRDQQICLLGAGGAAGGVLAALLERKPKSIVVANRTIAKAVELARRHQDLGPVSGTGLKALPEAAPFDLLINATSQGHGGAAPDVSAGLFASDGLCYDMNYGTASLPLKNLCGKDSVRYSDGLGMLVGQAALSFQVWTGEMPDTASVLEKLRATGK